MMKIFSAMLVFAVLVCAVPAIAESPEQAVLPAYAYPGDDPIMEAVANCIAKNAPAYYDHEQISVVIPIPVILKTVMADDTHADVYGGFWHMRYTKEGNTLLCISGSEAPGVMHLEWADASWTVHSVELAGDGEDYPKDIRRFCKGDEELEKAYFACSDVQNEPVKSIRIQFIRDYVEANQLDITAFQDRYWAPVSLGD